MKKQNCDVHRYKKYVFWVIAAVITAIAVAIFFLINPKQKTPPDSVGDVKRNHYFNATVLEVYENAVLVEPFKGEKTSPDTNRILVSKDVLSTNPVPELKVGSEIRIVYNGEVLEAYPASLGTVFAIYEIE